MPYEPEKGVKMKSLLNMFPAAGLKRKEAHSLDRIEMQSLNVLSNVLSRQMGFPVTLNQVDVITRGPVQLPEPRWCKGLRRKSREINVYIEAPFSFGDRIDDYKHSPKATAHLVLSGLTDGPYYPKHLTIHYDNFASSTVCQVFRFVGDEVVEE